MRHVRTTRFVVRKSQRIFLGKNVWARYRVVSCGARWIFSLSSPPYSL